MKRIISLFITALMIASMFTSIISGVSAADTVTEIGNTSPAITATAGKSVDLSKYTVVFDGDTKATQGIVWKDASGKTITSYTPSGKGVTRLTATAGSKSKTIYVVAKNASDTEYVLYEADFSGYTSLDDLKKEGWSITTPNAKLENGTFVLGSLNDAYARAILPAWLGDFGDYGITTEAKMLTNTDTGRWVGIVYHIQNANGKYYPYHHMCVRENTTASGIEFAERTTGDGWNVVLRASSEISSLKSAYYVFDVQTKGKKTSYSLDGKQVLYFTENVVGSSVSGKSAAYYAKGMIGLTMNYGTVSFKNIKVTVQENDPEKAKAKLELINNDRYELKTINPIANNQVVSDLSLLDSEDAPGSVLLEEDCDLKAALQKCLANNILPTVRIKTQQGAEALVSAMNATGFKDANAISADASLLKKIRNYKTLVRTGLIINPENYATEHEIRTAVRSAPATFCVIDSKYATRELISEIQEYAVAVWVTIDSDPDSEKFASEVLNAVTSGTNGIITLNSEKAAEVINTHLEKNAMTRTPIMIGHRGNPSQAPENSLSSFIAAYNNGADVFEVDVEITKDKQIIIMHDNTINRTTNYTGNKTINQMTLEEIKSYYLLDRDGKTVTTEKVPTLKEVLDEFKDKDCKIFVELKGSNAENVPVTMQLLQSCGMAYLVDVISFSNVFLNQTQKELPGMSTGFLCAPAISSCQDMESALQSLYESLVAAQNCNSTINPACGVVASNGNYYTKAVTDRGMTVWPWTYAYSYNDVGFFSGCDGVTTDDMQWVTNMAKYADAPDSKVIAKGQQLAFGAKVVTYGGREFVAEPQDTVVSVISGSDVVSVVDGKLVGIKEGTAEIILGYTASATAGGSYVVYTRPFTITVKSDKTALKSLIGYANIVPEKNYTAEAYAAITAALENANKVDADSNATVADIEAACATLAKALNNAINPKALSYGVPYTTTAPNRNGSFDDDGKRLTDGFKGSPSGGNVRAYSGWSNGVTVDVTLDMGEGAETNTYTVYTTSGFWGISAAKAIKVSVSDDGVNFTEVGSTDKKVELGAAGDKIDNHIAVMYTLSVITENVNKGRYVRISITPTGSHTWIDEVEATMIDRHQHIGGKEQFVNGNKEVYCTICGAKLTSEFVFVKGDVNGNGDVDAQDYALAKRYVLGTLTLTEEQIKRGDINGNGALEASEYALIKRHVLGTYTIK